VFNVDQLELELEHSASNRVRASSAFFATRAVLKVFLENDIRDSVPCCRKARTKK